ncbi:hypothetical protein [Paenibacillus piri]|uniref:Uncharacterized protein n=1 Tax=Paenibacillus piri TaxID=2547395 RepID=A0A4R5KP49_9BACL|nr:hypothetical protein [Paenibacillus piri]TDF96735.1 hypothetical protein E1757_16790 [Paenibacillus piri]
MKLIEFILNNWYLAVVAFFLLSGLIKRSKGSQPPKKSMPPFGGGPGGWGGGTTPTITTAKRPGQEEGRARGEDAQPRPRPEPRHAPEYKHESSEVDVWQQSDIDMRKGEISMPKHTDNAYAAAEPHASRSSVFDADKLAQGIMWAEILGPPRAKKPYRKIK